MKLFRTDDLNVAAFLQEEGFRLVNTERTNGHVVFLFDDPEGKAQATVMAFLNGALVAAVRYTDRLRHLKTICMRGIGG